MWGQLFSELTCYQNFTFGFPSTHSDVLLHLTHWQYWFWFWFTYALVLYYILFLNLISRRDLHYFPNLVTSLNSHGKWGDIIICFLPISWCMNILSNSNFILRMIEWQSEATLFTISVSGKQWYWVYNFEVNIISNLISIQNNLGHNHWLSEWKGIGLNYVVFLNNQNTLSTDFAVWDQSLDDCPNISSIDTNNLDFLGLNYYGSGYFTNGFKGFMPEQLTNYSTIYSYWTLYYTYSSRQFSIFTEILYYPVLNIKMLNFNDVSSVSQHTDIVTRVFNPTSSGPLTLRSGTFQLKTSIALTFQLNPQPISNYLVIKQNSIGFNSIWASNTNLQPFSIFVKDLVMENNTVNYKYSGFNSPYKLTLVYNSRLLRTNRILVLPSHINVGIITNSFDVIHSWFIPGLGINLDCVPGRSTHHTLYINHVGFYYGQCAEICGSYHHHMPIRICAIPFEQFLIWWYNYGSPYFLTNTTSKRPLYINYTTQLYNW